LGVNRDEAGYFNSLTTKLTGKIKMQSEAAQLYFVRVQRLVMPCPSLQSQP
jgi:hypothetical protein